MWLPIRPRSPIANMAVVLSRIAPYRLRNPAAAGFRLSGDQTSAITMMKPVKAAAMVARQAMQITSSLSYMLAAP